MSHTGDDGLLSALAGFASGAAPGVGSGIQRAQQARQQSFATQQASLTQALGFFGQQQRTRSKAEEAARKAERARIDKFGIVRFSLDTKTPGVLTPQLSANIKELENIEKIKFPQQITEEQKSRAIELRKIIKPGIKGRTSLATILAGGKEIDVEDLQRTFSFLDFAKGSEFASKEDLDAALKSALERQTTEAGKTFLSNATKAIFDTGEITVRPREIPELPPLPPPAKPPRETNAQKFERLARSRQVAISIVGESALVGSPEELRIRLAGSGLTEFELDLVVRTMEEFNALGKGQQDIVREIVESRPPLPTSGLPAPFPGAQAGLLPAGEDMLVGIQRGEAILPEPTVQALGGLEGIQQLAPGAIQPEERVGLLPSPVPIIAPEPQPEILPLRPSKGGLDLTDVQRPQIRQLAQNLAGPGVNEDDLDTISTLLDGIIESEDLAELT